MPQKHRKTCQLFILQTKTVLNESKLLMHMFVHLFCEVNAFFSPNFTHWSFFTTKRRHLTATKHQLTEQVQAMAINCIKQNKFNDNLLPKSWISLVISRQIFRLVLKHKWNHTHGNYEQYFCCIQWHNMWYDDICCLWIDLNVFWCFRMNLFLKESTQN